MKRFLLLFSVICLFAAGQEIKTEGKVSDFKAFKPEKKPKKVDLNLPESPLVVKGSKTPTIELGRVFKLNQRLFPVIVENPSDNDVEYDNIVINCNCTNIVNKLDITCFIVLNIFWNNIEQCSSYKTNCTKT